MFVDPQSYPLAKHRQGIVYGITHDVSLKIAIKNHKSPKDVMDYLPVKTDLDEIKAALETEGRTTKASDDIQADDNFDDEDDEGCRLPGGRQPCGCKGGACRWHAATAVVDGAIFSSVRSDPCRQEVLACLCQEDNRCTHQTVHRARLLL